MSIAQANNSTVPVDSVDTLTDIYNATVTALLVEHGSDGVHSSVADAVLKALFNANTILAANTDNTPVALTVAEQRLVGRITSGNITALTATQIRTLINVEDGSDATDATNVNSAGAVMESDYNANTILVATTDDTPAAVTILEQRLLGRITSGNIAALTTAQVRTLINVEDNADVTDATNVNSAGAVMESDYDANTILYATTNDTPVTLTIAASRIVGRASSGNIVALTAAQTLTILGLDSNLADLTTAEVQQVENIGTTTISAAQWGYLGACVTGGGQLLAALTTGESTQLEAIGATTISATQWGYLGACTAAGGALLDDADADTQLTTLGLSQNLGDLTDAEAAQLENIGITTISTSQWGYLGACSAGGGQLLAALTTGESTQLQAIDGTTISVTQWGYLGACTSAGGALLNDADADTQLTTLGLSQNLGDLTDGEAAQLENIGTTTISAAQWGYLGACVAGGGQLLAALTTAESTQLEAIGSTTISAAQWGYVGAMTTPPLGGDGTAGREWRISRLTITNGTNDQTLKCTLSSRWNGDAIATTDNIAKNATTGDFTLTSDGKSLYIEPTGLSGNVVVAFGHLGINACGTDLSDYITETGGKIFIRCYHSTAGTYSDITTLVNTGQMQYYILYITDA